MRNHTFDHEPPAGPLRSLRVLIEDPVLADHEPPTAAPFDITICSGPDHEAETCPLVMEGTCPFGSFDVVVGALDGPWERAVRGAWAETSTVYVDLRLEEPPEDPSARLRHHLGAVVGRVFEHGHDDEADQSIW